MSSPLAGTLATWPRRRFVAAGVLTPALVAVFAGVTGLLAHGAPGWVWAVTVLDAVLGAGVLASYLPAPGSGRRLEIGCEPCATVAALGVVGALLLRASGPADPALAALSVFVLLAASRQRLTDNQACRTVPPAATAPPGATTSTAPTTPIPSPVEAPRGGGQNG